MKEIGKSDNKLSVVVQSSSPKEITSSQPSLDLGIEKDTEINGIGMGVLSDGTNTRIAIPTIIRKLGQIRKNLGAIRSRLSGSTVSGCKRCTSKAGSSAATSSERSREDSCRRPSLNSQSARWKHRNSLHRAN